MATKKYNKKEPTPSVEETPQEEATPKEVKAKEVEPQVDPKEEARLAVAKGRMSNDHFEDLYGEKP